MDLPTAGSPPERESTLSSALINSSSITGGRKNRGKPSNAQVRHLRRHLSCDVKCVSANVSQVLCMSKPNTYIDVCPAQYELCPFTPLLSCLPFPSTATLLHGPIVWGRGNEQQGGWMSGPLYPNLSTCFEGARLTQLVQLVTAGRLFPCHKGQVNP